MNAPSRKGKSAAQSVSRRQFLTGAAAAATVAVVKPSRVRGTCNVSSPSRVTIVRS